jgi:hypothetical protein
MAKVMEMEARKEGKRKEYSKKRRNLMNNEK